MPEEVPVVLEKYKPDEDPFRVVQTGWETGEIFIIKMASHNMATTSALLTNLMKMPTKRTDYDSKTELEAAAPTTFYGIDEGSCQFLEWLLDLVSQARTFVRQVRSSSTWPVKPSVVLGVDGLACAFWYLCEDMRRGLMHEGPNPMYLIDAATPILTAANTVAKVIAGLDWKIIATPTPDSENNWTQVRRWIYALGLYWQSSFPKFFARFDSMQEVQITRTVEIFTAAAIYVIADFYFLSAAQSDRAMFNIAFLRKGLVSGKIDPSLATSIERFWDPLAKLGKYARYDGTKNASYTTNFIDAQLVNSESVEESIHDYNTEFVVCDLALKLARSMFGISKYDKAGEVKHFASLLDLANSGGDANANTIVALSDTGFDTHGISTWMLGANMAICQKYLQDCRMRDEEWEFAVRKKLHWTHAEISEWAATIFTKFSMKGSLMGLCEASAYKALKRNIYSAADAGGIIATGEGRDPNLVHSTSTLQLTMAKAGYISQSPWILLFLQGYMKEQSRLIMPTDWTIEEFIQELRFGMLLGKVDAYATSGRKWLGKKLHFVQAVNSKTKEVIEMWKMKDEEIRVEFITDVLAHTTGVFTTPALSAKYAFGLVEVAPDPLEYNSEARPKGIEDQGTCFIPRFGDPNVMKAILSRVYGPLSSTKAAAPAAPSTPASVVKPASNAPPTANSADAEGEGE
jgi:hypothetical protein